ncbi:MAG: TonB-dependent receptor [Burkholderiales bacterium]|nr:TonB-dependent receptor [Burkholderiales bacterium]
MIRHPLLTPIGHALLGCGLLAACLPAAAQTAAPAAARPPASAASQPEAAPTAPPAAAGKSLELPVIVVTAQKRVQNVKEVPIAVSVVNGEQLDKQGIRSIGDLSKTAASLEFGDQQAGGAGGSASIRGIGTAVFTSSAESSVGVVVDGVPQGNTAGGSLFDLDRVEVLRGPQGTLFGKNASAGVLNLVTTAPRIGRFEGTASAEFSGGQTRNAVLRGAVNVPINGMSALRVTAHADRLQGVYENRYTGEDSQTGANGVRLRYLLKPSADLVVNLIADHDVTRTTGATFFAPFVANAVNTAGNHQPRAEFAACGVNVSSTNNQVCSDVPEHLRTVVGGVSGQVDYTLGGGMTLTSITAMRERSGGPDDSRSISMNLAPDKITNTAGSSYARQLSQEVRLASAPRQPVEWVVGAFFSDYDAWNSNTTNIYPSPFAPSPPVPRSISTRIDRATQIQSAALFGQAITQLSEQASLVTGLRYTQDKVHDTYFGTQNVAFQPFAAPTSTCKRGGTAKEHNLSGKLGLLYTVDKSTNFYATITRGYKGPQIVDDCTPPQSGHLSSPSSAIQPEVPTSLEAGVKTTLLDRRLNLDLAVFRTRIRNFQEQNCTLSPVGALVCTPLNVPSVTTSGMELDLRARLTPALTLSASGALILGTEYPQGFSFDGNDVTGQRLLYSPKGKLTLGVEYATPVFGEYEWTLGADLTYKTRVRYCNTLAVECSFKAHTIAGLHTGLRNPADTWGLNVFVRNATDERVPSAILYPLPGKGAGSGYAYSLSSASFRSYGVTLDLKF